ncbi:DctP family TRAP transporter solute-binding subunit [Magnetospira sp. QH-2]|uniref:DctP family TRAP transporter solute-binding subunit n=1 Tax=Magnetospira sp. (strain QH-2) TaxID=1288970 RepID=UPI0003E8115E|nr:DctP family TRAP transporter solute-binding subunit [Magnetospira sp. QH-2]CCQ73262.1 TRAP-Type C4-dicarboxylate transport system, binding periplasmic protein (DctP subunit) [Magnetospira sp. QH-2]
MRLFTTGIAAVAATAFMLTAAPATVSAKEIIIKFSHVTGGKTHPKVLAANLFAERVNERMKGKVKVEVYPSGQLFNDDKLLIELAKGKSVQMGSPSLSKFETFTKKFRIFDLPFLFDDINAVNAFQQSEHGQGILRSMEKKGILGLTFWHNGMKQMSANKPLVKPEDAKGLKFRVQQSDVLVAQFQQLGAVPQKMAFKEVYGALQTGVVDGQENTWSNIFTKKFFEVQDGVTETDHGILDYAVIVSKRFWMGLPDDIRTELNSILMEVTAERNNLARELNLNNRQKILDNKGVVRTLTAEQRAAWKAAMKPVWDRFADEIGPDLLKAADGFNK